MKPSLLAAAVSAATLLGACATSPDSGHSASRSTEPTQPNAPMQAVLDELASLGGKPIETLAPAEARRQPTPADAVKSLLRKRGTGAAPEPVADVRDRTIPGPDGPIAARVYTPAGPGPFPVIVYYHGGGFVIADLDTYDSSPRALANAAGAVVVSSHYRQAPEHKYPAAHEDAFAAYRWVLANAAALRGDAKRVAVAGESAGGNLAAAVALRARDQGVQAPVHQVLIYPVADHAFDTPSQRQYAAAKPLSTPMLRWFYGHYLRTPADGADPMFSVLRAPSLAGLPPATVITAEIDPLRSEGTSFAQRLAAAGVPVDYRNYPGVTHEFFGMGAVLPDARQAVEQAAGNLKKSFAR